MPSDPPPASSQDVITPDEAHTLDGLFYERVRRTPLGPAYQDFDRFMGNWRRYTWREMAGRTARWVAALAGENLAPGERVGVVLRNCPDWVAFDQAAMNLGLVVVPLFTDDRADNVAFILADAGVRLLLVQDEGRWRRLAEALDRHPSLERVLILQQGRTTDSICASDPRARMVEEWLPETGTPLIQRNADPDSLASIVYTSGTTGRPKGVMLSHRNMLAIAHGGAQAVAIHTDDVFLSFLPLSHTLERTAGYYLPMMAGAEVGFARSVTQLADDLQMIRPTLMVAVPRVFERFLARLKDTMARGSAARRGVFDLAVSLGWQRFQWQQGRGSWNPGFLMWPKLDGEVGEKVRERFGGRLRGAVSGGAALSHEVARVFIALGVPLIQGYGLTETSPVVSVNRLEDNDPLSVGKPLAGVEVRLGPADELLVKGPGVMLGYWNNPKATASMIDGEGWLHTGDQARIEGDRIYITGRIKDILVLSNGEKIPPTDMEMAITMDPLFDQVMVVGEGQAYLAALVVLNQDLWIDLAQEKGLDPYDLHDLQTQEVQTALLGRIRHALAGFPGYAKIRRVSALLEPWTVENGLLTPTLKLKRAQVLAQFGEEVRAMYLKGAPG